MFRLGYENLNVRIWGICELWKIWENAGETRLKYVNLLFCSEQTDPGIVEDLFLLPCIANVSTSTKGWGSVQGYPICLDDPLKSYPNRW